MTIASAPTSPSAYAPGPFANFTQLPSYLPAAAWRLLRWLSVAVALGLAALLVVRPALGLQVFWGLAVPALPLAFMFVPGLWRNLCPLASSNQAPRRLELTRGRAQRTLSPAVAYPVGIALCVGLIVSRKLLFNGSGPATAGLLMWAMGSAFFGGLLFKGKSGWCSSICPLLPVQRLYGQTPFIRVANTQCEPCVGCAKNCYDFNPGAAYLADQYDPNPAYRNFRRFFAGIFPGLVLGFYLTPSASAAAPSAIVVEMLMYMASSFTVFTLLDMLVGKTRNLAPVLFAAVAFNIYYWFAAAIIFQTLTDLGFAPDKTLVGALRTAASIGSLVWLARSMHVERIFLREQVKKGVKGEIRLAPIVVETVRLNRKALSLQPGARKATPSRPATASPAVEATPREAGTEPAELCIAPTGTVAALRKGQVLLDVLEGCGAAINAGCRAGACGADPIAVIDGQEQLAPACSEEQATLDRLGHAPNTRLACMARVRAAGPITIELKPHAKGARPQEQALTAPPAATVKDFDRSIRRIVIIGNGVAGLTAAEHVRRLHTDCEIDLVGRENHSAYNRMAIARLISGRNGMTGLQLLPDQWYAEKRVNAWLATHVRSIDTARQEVTLATGETLRWDRLILATGSSAWIPPMAGFGVPGSFVLRDADDALSIRTHVQKHGAKSAVVVGAGLLGLEAAQAMRQLRLSVVVLSNSEQVLDRQIDAGASELLCRHLQTQGIEVACNALVRAVHADRQGRCRAVELTDGRRLAADIVIACTGARPNLELASDAGLATGRGIVVDEHMRTSAKHVYAAGDVAEFAGQVHGLWAVAMQQGEIAARNALGEVCRYAGHIPVTALKVSGISVRSAGVVAAVGSDDREDVRRDRKAASYCKIVERNGTVIGAVMVGPVEGADVILKAVRERTDFRTLECEIGGQFSQPRPAEALAG
jgi:nitrite reductase (NADH) large subunit